MFKVPKMVSFRNSAKVMAHRAEDAAYKDDFERVREADNKRKCRHAWNFDPVFSWENGAGEVHYCSKCGQKREERR